MRAPPSRAGLLRRLIPDPSPGAPKFKWTEVRFVARSVSPSFLAPAPAPAAASPGWRVFRFSAPLLCRFARCCEYRFRLAASPFGLHQKKYTAASIAATPTIPPTAPPTVAPVEGPEPEEAAPLPSTALWATQTRLAQVWQDWEICWQTWPFGQVGHGPIGSGQLMQPLDMFGGRGGAGSGGHGRVEAVVVARRRVQLRPTRPRMPLRSRASAQRHATRPRPLRQKSRPANEAVHAPPFSPTTDRSGTDEKCEAGHKV